jgi:hypothetical protein
VTSAALFGAAHISLSFEALSGDWDTLIFVPVITSAGHLSTQKGPEGPLARLHPSDFYQDANRRLTFGDHSPMARPRLKSRAITLPM